ncbi:MAG: hypothetical protein K0R26_89 [Bacteroidota bacterium]|jgi:hypothetical protein|nr:hypothetical protein [Bacteroidota bacterium]
MIEILSIALSYDRNIVLKVTIMRAAILIFIMGFFANTGESQTIRASKVPEAVKQTFTKQYPEASIESWQKSGSNYEAEFTLHKEEGSALYDSNGNFIESESPLQKSDLPKEVMDYIALNLSRKKIREAGKIVDANGKVRYRAEIGNEEYIFDSDCSFVRKEDASHKNQQSN